MLTPSQFVSSFDHLVTQWISFVKDCRGNALNFSHVHCTGTSTNPPRSNVHFSSGIRGVGPALSTGKPEVSCWPGGILSLWADWRFRPKPLLANDVISVGGQMVFQPHPTAAA